LSSQVPPLSSGRPQPVQIIFAALIGTSISSVVFGRAVLALIVALGVILVLIDRHLRQTAWRQLRLSAIHPVGILVIVTMLLWSVSALGSSFPVRSLEAALRSGLFVAVGVIVYAVLRTNPRLHEFSSRVVIASTAVAVTIAVLEMTVLPELYWVLRLKGWHSTPLDTELKSFSSLIVFLFPLLAMAGWKAPPSWRLWAVFAATGLVILAWHNSNRAALAGLLGAVLISVIALFVRYGAKRVVISVVLGVGALFAVVFTWLSISRSHLSDVAPANDWFFPVWLIDFQRQTIWAHSLEIVRQAPWFGIGPNTINFAPGADQPLPGNESLHLIPAHPHNWMVEVFAETGAFGLAALLITLVVIATQLLLEYRRTAAPKYMAAIAVLAGYWVSGLFNFSYWSAWWQLCFALAMAFALSALATGPSKK